MDVLTLKLEESKLGLFNRVPLSLYRQKDDERRLTPSSYALFGKIYNFSHTSDSEAMCRLTYDQVRHEYGWARSTVAAAFDQLRSSKKIRKIDRDQDGTAYAYVDELPGKQYDNIPQYLYTAEICVSGERRRMKESEIRVLARFMTECAYPKNGGNPLNGGGVYNVSNKKLARLVCLSETTVKKAIRALMKARLVYRSAKNKGINRYKLSGYEVARECYVYKKYAVKRKAKSQESLPNEIKAANDRADRARFYAQRREEAQARADKYLAIANGSEHFKTVTKKLSLMEIELAKAELHNPCKLPELKEEKRRLQAERAQSLLVLDITEEMLVPQWTCKKCEDSGFLPNGRACGCYDPGGGR